MILIRPGQLKVMKGHTMRFLVKVSFVHSDSAIEVYYVIF